jgi:hypothetical protein
MEMYELRRAAPGWELAWHGCVVSKQDFNDVAALADGGFIATHPTALRAPGDTSNLFGGQPTGYVARWSAATGEVEMPGTRIGYPNGLVVTPDNLTWTSDRHILAAGVVGVRGDCPAKSGVPCGQGFGVAQIDPATMQFQGGRLAKLPLKK